MPEIDLEWTGSFSFERINRGEYALEAWPADDPEAAAERLALSITEEYLVRCELPQQHPNDIGAK